MSDDLSILHSPAGLAADVRGMIEQTRGQVARVVNVGMTLLYWRIGKRIQVEILGNQRAEYGKEILATLSQELVDEFGTGFSAKNLRHMMRFSEAFPDAGIVSTLSGQLGWSHFKEIIYLKDDLQRDFYAEILAVCFRVESYRRTQFCRWSNTELRELIVKGFVKRDGPLARVREIRTSRKRFYPKVRSIFALRNIVCLAESTKNDYNLSPSGYILTSDAETYRPIAAIVEELKVIEAEARETDKTLKEILEKLGI